MAVFSMTGFARTQGQGDGYVWAWEVRSVNGKGLDLRFRLPSGYEVLETQIRAVVQRRVLRGSITVSLWLKIDASTVSVRINEPWLHRLMDLARDLPAHVAPPRFDGLLMVRGVLEPVEGEEDDIALEARHAVLLRGLDETITDLIAARGQEGCRLTSILLGHLAGIEEITDCAWKTASALPETLRKRVRTHLALLLEAKPPVDEDRLVQEIALIATRLDVREELDRLKAHVSQARVLLQEGGPCGRRLDFLAQEFNREANTLCSKSQDSELTCLGLRLKAVIDQFREQAQNVE